MAKAMPITDLGKLVGYLAGQIGNEVMLDIHDRPPCSFDDFQEQIKATAAFMLASKNLKSSGNYLLAAAYLFENLKYYHSTGERGKSGHVLIEIADCLFSVNRFDASIICCEEAVNLLLGRRKVCSWARPMAGVAELLLAAILVNVREVDYAASEMRSALSRLAPSEKHILFKEDGHRIRRRLIESYRKKTSKPIAMLVNMRPIRKSIEKGNLLGVLDELTERYRAIRIAVEKTPT